MQMHRHFKTETNNTSCKGNTALWQLPTRKIRKFIKSKFKILTCVVLLGRLNTMRGISAGKYDKGNKSIIMRGIWVGKIYIAINYCLSLALPCYSENHNQLLKHLLFAFKIFFDQIFVHFCFMGGFNRRCSLIWPSCFFKVYAMPYLMWPPFWYNSKSTKKKPLFLNPYPFIQKSPFKYFIML